MTRDPALEDTEPCAPVTVRNGTQASILIDPDGASLKRIAWAFGCARKGSEEERRLEEILVARVVGDKVLTGGAK